jgi:hypothetical protein
LERGSDQEQVAPFSCPGADSELYLILDKVSQMGLKRYPWEPLSKWMERMESSGYLLINKDELLFVLALHYRYRYDPRGIEEKERAELKSRVHSLLERL